MPEDNGWNEVIAQENNLPATSEEPTDQIAEIPNEAPNGDIPEAPNEDGGEDPDAWRNVRFDEDASKMHKIFLEASEKSPAVRRALHSFASLKVEREAREREIEMTERLEAAEQRAKESEVRAGNQFWGRMTKPQRDEYLGKNPQHIENFNQFVTLARELQQAQSQPQVPGWVKKLVNNARDLVSENAPHLSEEHEMFLRSELEKPETFAQYKDEPYVILDHLREFIDSHRTDKNNGAVQADATPRSPVTVADGARSRNESQVQTSPANPGIGKFAPDTTRRTTSSGGGKSYTRSEIAAMDPDDYGALRERHGAKTGQELYRRGVIVDD